MNFYESKINNIREKTFAEMEKLKAAQLINLNIKTLEEMIFSYDSDTSILKNIFYSIILNKKNKYITLIDSTNIKQGSENKIQNFNESQQHEIYKKILIGIKSINGSEQKKIGPYESTIHYQTILKDEILNTSDFLTLMQTINNANLAMYNILLESKVTKLSFDNNI